MRERCRSPGRAKFGCDCVTAALNHLDLFVLAGIPGIPIGLPHVGGADGAGIVDAVGPGVEGVETGLEVVFDPGLSCGQCEYCRAGEESLCVRFGVLGEHNDGTFAEFVVVAADSLAPRPSHLSWEESAAFGLTYLTAWRMMINRGGLQSGESVLIHGIGGGVSLACLQLAKLKGAQCDRHLEGSKRNGLERWNWVPTRSCRPTIRWRERSAV